MAKKALVTGITGQDGAYLSRLLLEKGYEVYGTYRRASTLSLWRLKELGIDQSVTLVCMELTDMSSIIHTIQKIQPDEVYNLAAQSFVHVSFEQPVHTGDVNGLSVVRLLDALRLFCPKTRFFQASTSEMFGRTNPTPLNETSSFLPRNPYATGKLYAHCSAINYRESFNLFTAAAILFNHESPLRGQEFVSRKITSGFAAVQMGQQEWIELGTMDSKRDWGYAGDYVDAMWRMLQQEVGDVYLLATGRMTSIREFVEISARCLDVDLVWKGSGVNEIGLDRATGKIWVKINPQFYRPAETQLVVGDPSKAMAKLGWKPKVSLEQMVEMMVKADLNRLAGQALPHAPLRVSAN